MSTDNPQPVEDAPESPPDEVKLCHYVEDALSLQGKLDGWAKDNAYIDEGGRLVYSADADVIKLYLSPAENAAPRRLDSGKVRPGYTTVFRYDGKITAAALADGVCDAIFFHGKERALGTVTLEPIQEELQNIFHALLNDASEAPGIGKRLVKLRNELRDKFEAKGLSDEERFKEIAEKAQDLADKYFGDSGYVTQLDRLKVLVTESRLKPLSRFFEDDLDSELSERILEPYSWYETMHYTRIKNELDAKLSRTKKSVNALADAEAIASLAIINWRLASHKIRFLHVTGDPSLYSALAETPFHYFIDEWDDCPDLKDWSFARAFLRHPASFLAAPDVPFPKLRSDDREPIEGISGLLGYLLSGIPQGSEQAGEKLLVRCRRALATYPDAIRNFESRWKALVGPLIIKQLESAARLRSVLATEAFQTLSERIDAEVEERWMRCLETALSTGFNFIVVPKTEGYSPSRDVPIIWFDCVDADDALGRIQDSLLQRAQDDPQRAFDYETPLKKLAAVRHSEYFNFLTFAVLYAGNGKWKTTAMLANQAIGIAEAIRKQERRALRDGDDEEVWAGGSSKAAVSGVSGREAYYVAAAARRVGAQEEADFDAAAKLLVRAGEALEEDRQYVRAHGKASYVDYLTSTRFEIEALGLDLSRYLFARFANPPREPATLDPGEFTERVEVLLARAEQEKDPRTACAERRRLLMHLFVRFLHDPNWREAVQLSQSAAEAMRERLRQLEATVNERAPASYILSTVLLAAKFELRIEQSKAQRRIMERDATLLFKPEVIARNIVAAYDEKRFQQLADICENAKAAP
jgi:hypothetical protein